MKKLTEKIAPYASFIGLIVVALVFILTTGGKMTTPQNLQILLNQSYTLVLLAIGVTFIFTHGGIDFSMGSVIALSAMVMGLLINSGVPVIISGIIGMLAAVFCSALTGFLTVSLNLPAFISSLCMMNIARGIVTTTLSSNKIKISKDLTVYSTWTIKLIVLLVLFLAAFWILEYSLIGKYNKAIGENPIAAAQSGVPVKRYRVYAYIINGFCIGVAAFFLLCRTTLVNSGLGMGLELQVIVAVMLGGLAVKGGARSSVRCALIGSVIIAILGNGLVIWGIDDMLVEGAEGLVFLLTIFIAYLGQRSMSKGKNIGT